MRDISQTKQCLNVLLYAVTSNGYLERRHPAAPPWLPWEMKTSPHPSPHPDTVCFIGPAGSSCEMTFVKDKVYKAWDRPTRYVDLHKVIPLHGSQPTIRTERCWDPPTLKGFLLPLFIPLWCRVAQDRVGRDDLNVIPLALQVLSGWQFHYEPQSNAMGNIV